MPDIEFNRNYTDIEYRTTIVALVVILVTIMFVINEYLNDVFVRNCETMERVVVWNYSCDYWGRRYFDYCWMTCQREGEKSGSGMKTGMKVQCILDVSAVRGAWQH